MVDESQFSNPVRNVFSRGLAGVIILSCIGTAAGGPKRRLVIVWLFLSFSPQASLNFQQSQYFEIFLDELTGDGLSGTSIAPACYQL
jgi:hypothetical protein